jgi:hypothetical protein
MSCDRVDRLNSEYVLLITDGWMITAVVVLMIMTMQVFVITAVVWVLYDYRCMLALQFCNSDDDLNIRISEWMVWNDVLTMPDNNVWFDAWCMM